MVIRKGLLRHPRQPKLSSQRKMKLKSSKPTCNFNHAILAIVSRLFLLKAVCQTISQSTKTHNTSTYYSNAYIRTSMYSNFFLGEVVLWYSIYILLAQIRTTWVASTYLFTYALTAKLKHIGLLKSVNLKGPNLWSKRRKFNTSSREICNLEDSNFRWKSVELSKLKNFIILLDKIQWTLKSSHKDIRTTIFVLRCKRKAKQFEAHSIYKSLLGTKFLVLKQKINYV